jgi:hypothetical protein
MGGTGDGLQPSSTHRARSLALAPSYSFQERAAMSYRAIAAASALEDLSVGQRLTAFSLASFANRQHRAWPSAGTAAARAALSRRQYLAAHAELERRGLIMREGNDYRSSLVALSFADLAASIDREVNAELFEATLARSRTRGGARVLLAVLAALAGRDGIVDGLSVEDLSERRAGCQTAPIAAPECNCSPLGK